MDRRAFLAVVLTFILLIAWQYFVILPKSRELARKRALEMKARKADTTESTESQKPENVQREVQEAVESESTGRVLEHGVSTFYSDSTFNAPDRFITVVTERFKMVLRTDGAEVEQVELLDFTRKDGSLVSLVPEGSKGGFGVYMKDQTGLRGLSNLNFDAYVAGRKVSGDTTIFLGEGYESVRVDFVRKGNRGAEVRKSFYFQRDGYDFGVSVWIKREGDLLSTTGYGLVWDAGLSVTEKNKKYDLRQFASLGMVGDEFYQIPLRNFKKTKSRREEGTVIWAGARTKYFLVASIVDEESRRSGSLELKGDASGEFVGFALEFPFRGDPRVVEDHYTCYVGPLDMKGLKAYGIGLERTIDLGKLRFLSVAILKLMLFMRKFIPNYGLIIVILSIMTKLLFYRLTHKSFKSMKDMQRLQPKIKELQERYKNDKERLNREMMKLYKEAGVNPLGGCLPLLLQMPVFLALYNVLRNTIELRGAHFIGWIDDLSSPDVLFDFGANIPFLGSEFHLLPILMGGAMVLQSKLGASPTGDTTAPGQSAMMSTMMPIIFTIFFYGMPSGLVLYWFVNNILTIVQQYYVHKEIEAEERAKVNEKKVKPRIKRVQEDDRFVH